MTRHFLADDDLTPAEQAQVLDLAAAFKADRYATRDALAGRSVAVVFEKPSTRTRLSFEIGVAELGAHPVVLDAASTQLGRGETIEDTARVLQPLRQRDRAAHVRPGADRGPGRGEHRAGGQRAHRRCSTPARCSPTCRRSGSAGAAPQGQALAYLGDGANNMAHSLLVGGAMAGMHVRVGAPEGYLPDPAVVERGPQRTAPTVVVTTDPREAADGADVLSTDVWVSMGEADAAERRRDAHARTRWTRRRSSAAAPDAVVLHCLPAHRGEEIAACGDRRAAVGGLGPGGEPAARAEGAAGVPAAGRTAGQR